MKLSSYLDINDISDAGFARQLGVSRQAVQRYRTADRRPAEEIILKIYLVTKGAVTPNDFMKLPKLRSGERT